MKKPVSLLATVNWRRFAAVLVGLSALLAAVLAVAFPNLRPGAFLMIIALSAAATFGAALIAIALVAAQDDVLLERVINGPLNWLFGLGAPKTGPQAMLGTLATVIEPFNSERRGRVEVRGVIWSALLAHDASPPAPGAKVKILEVTGLTVTVGTP